MKPAGGVAWTGTAGLLEQAAENNYEEASLGLRSGATNIVNELKMNIEGDSKIICRQLVDQRQRKILEKPRSSFQHWGLLLPDLDHCAPPTTCHLHTKKETRTPPYFGLEESHPHTMAHLARYLTEG